MASSPECKQHECQGTTDALDTIQRSYTIALRADNCKETTVRSYLITLRFFADYCRTQGFPLELDSITRQPVRAWIAELVATKSSSTAQTRYRGLHRFFEFCTREGLLEHSPMETLRPPKLNERIVQPYTEEEVQRLIDARSGKSWLDQRDVAIMWFLVDTGARANEALQMAWEDVDLDTGQVRLRGKGGVERIVRMGYQVQLALDRYRRACPHNAPDVWLAQDGGRLSYNSLYRIVSRAGKSVGIRGANIHRLRHTMGTIFLKYGGTRQSLQEILGHKTDHMTRRYVQTVAHAIALKEHEQHSPADWLREHMRQKK